MKDPGSRSTRTRRRLRRAAVYALVLGVLLLGFDGIGGAVGLVHPDRTAWDADILILAIGAGLMFLANR